MHSLQISFFQLCAETLSDSVQSPSKLIWARSCDGGWFPNQPLLSFPFLPFLSRPFPSFPFLSRPFPFFPFLSLSFRSFPVLSIPFPFFPECVARVPVAQPSATTRNRPRDCYMAVPLVSSLEGVIFAFRVAGVASDVFCNVSKVILCGRRNTFATFSEDALQFSWQAQHFGRVHRHFAWQAQHFRRIVLRVFYESNWQGCVKWRQGADSVADVAFCETCWKLTEASHETSILR